MAPRRAGAEVAKLLSLYNVYRAVLGIVILTLGLADATRLTKIEGYHAGLIWLAVIWLSSAALLLWQVRFIASKADGGPLGVILFDLVMIAFLVRLGQPLGPGLPLLYLLTVAAGALLISNRITATAAAALASIAILSDSTYQLQQGLIDANGMLSAGLLGVINLFDFTALTADRRQNGGDRRAG